MLDVNKYLDHIKIEQFLKRRSMQLQETRKIINYENQLSNFPIGLIITTKDNKNEDKMEFINHYACQLFQLKENAEINELKDKLNDYVRLKSSEKNISNITLKDILFSSSFYNYDIENFFPFQCKHSKYIILYIKVNDIGNKKYIVIDKYDKYIEEQKYIEFNLIKNINYQYLHTLYHELNNPLNALLAISGEKIKFDSSENLNKNSLYNKTATLKRKKTVKTFVKGNKMRLPYKRENKYSGVSLNYSKKVVEDYKSKRKSLYETSHDDYKSKRKSVNINNINNVNNTNNANNNYNSQDTNSRINLLVKIIKIFLKNFILYLKTRADSLFNLQNEFSIQNEESDIMNAVEVSEYERDLTKHKKVKLNLEYILDLYLQKYKCLFKYKEIEYETNFSELKNIYILTDDFNFTYYIRQIYTYLYYVVEKKEGFLFCYDKSDSSKIKIIIKKKKSNERTLKIKDDMNDFSLNQIIQTKEMTKEVLYFMSKKLKCVIEFFDDDNNKSTFTNNNKGKNIYLSVTMPIMTKDKSTEEDEFKDEDINEMVDISNNLLEQKIKRQLPIFSNINKIPMNISISNVDMLSKNDISESYMSYSNKNNNSRHNSITKNNIGSKFVNININEYQKDRFLSFKSTPSNDSFLNKCLKQNEYNNKEKEKKEMSKFKKNPNNNNNQLNINYIQNNINKSSSGKNIFINITNINNSPANDGGIKYTKTKSHNSPKKTNEKNNKTTIKSLKTHKIKEVFNLINFYGSSKKIINYNQNVYNITDNSQKDVRKKFILSKKSLKSKKSINKTPIFKNKKNSAQLPIFAKKIPLKINSRSSDFISYFYDENIKNIRKNNLRKKMTMNTLAKNKKDLGLKKKENNNKKNKKIENKDKDKDKDKDNIENFFINKTPYKSSKECFSVFIENKNINIINEKNDKNENNDNTLIDDTFDDNKQLFLDADKERDIFAQKSINKNKDNLPSNGEGEEDVEDEEEEEDDEEENEPSKEQCNCTDLLIVDDEEFNVMATQRMLKNLGYTADKAFNGEECINLIKSKKESKCSCEKNYYKIIFLDIVMPVMDGIQTAKKVQEMIENKEINDNTKIVFVSGNIDGSDLQESLLKIKCVKECLQKPVQIAKYQKMLEKYYKKND